MTPNTGYWMPWWAYADFLEDRGMDVGEVRELGDECEWCYPFGHRVEYAAGDTMSDMRFGAYSLSWSCGSSYSGNEYAGWCCVDGDSGTWTGNGYAWLLYD